MVANANHLADESALLAVGFLDRYFRTRTLTPVAIYSLAVGIGCIVFFAVR